MLVDICQFASSHLHHVWKALCNHLEYGDLDLKTVSLDALSSLISARGIPMVPVKGYFLSCLLGLINLLCSKETPLEHSERKHLELSTGRLVTSLTLSGERDGLALDHRFLQRLAAALGEQGLTGLCTEQLRAAVASLVIHAVKNTPLATVRSAVYLPSLEVFASHALSIIESESSCEFVIPLLVHLALVDVQQSVGEGAADVGLSGLDSRKRGRDGVRVKKQEWIGVYSALLGGLSDSSSDKNPVSSQEMKYIHVTLQVAARCLIHIGSTDQTLRFPLLTEFVINTAMDIWVRFLRSLTIDGDQSFVFKDIYKTILKSTASILLANDIQQMHGTVLQEFCWIISLPWLGTDLQWKDLKPLRSKEVALIAAKLGDKFDLDCLSVCIRTLALLPRDTCSAWRCHVLAQALDDRQVEMREVAASCFPVFLQNLGPKSSHLLQTHLKLLQKDPSDKMCSILAKTLGGLALAQADIGRVLRPPCDVYTTSFEDVSLELNPLVDFETMRDRGKSLNLAIIHPFLKLLRHPDPAIRKDLLCSVCIVFDVANTESVQGRKLVEACLDSLDDSHLDVRMQCSALISHIVRKETLKKQTSGASTNRLVWEKLDAINLKAHRDNNWPLLETVLNAIGQFARRTEDELLESAIIRLLESRLSRKVKLAAVASEELQGVATFKVESLQTIYVRYKQAICKFLVEAMYTDQMNCDGVNIKSILTTIASTVEAEDVKTLLQGGEKYILPYLVSKASPQSSKLIKVIASLQSTTNIRRSMLMNNTKYIFSYLVRSCQKEEMEKALLYLQGETDFSLGNLLRLDFQRVHNELLLHLSSHYQQVFNGLKTLAAHDEQYKGPKDIDTTEQMAQYLEPRLLGVLAFFDAQLMNSNIIMQDKKLALKSVISIIRLMGSKHITSIRHKMMNTLRLALNFRKPDFVDISCKAWNCFVRSIELPLLGPMMSQVIATLLPLLQILPDQVVPIINYMIVENQSELHKYFQDIYFLPDIPELQAANTVLKGTGDKSSNNTDLKAILARSIKGVLHESLDVRAHALSKLRKILKDRWTELNNYVMNSEPAEPILSELVSALLSGCRETDTNTQILYGQCLGELGAIDPGRLDFISKGPIAKLSSFHPSIDEDDFAFGLINTIVKAFLAATEPRVQDCAAFALQELLQIYEISGQREDQGLNSTSRLWQKFPEQTQEILVPLINSKYKLTVEAKYKNYPKPIYGSEKGKTFKDWVSNWTGYLISKVKAGKACQVFTACIATKRHNQQVALYMLPHIVLHVLQDGSTDDVTELFEELMTVLQHVQIPESQQASMSNLHHLSAQTVFSVLDYLTMWRSHRMQITTQAASGAVKAAAYEKDSGYQAVHSFLEKIPQEIFAKACFNCKAYARALRHFEMFIASGQNIQQHLDFMQRLYVSMDEPDGVLGVAAIRVSQPTLMQQILTHESLGQQQDAQACYERAIQMDPEEISHHMGLLRSLIDLAQPNKALIHTAGILADRPRWTSQLNSYRIEAAWELGNWDKLEQALNIEKHASSNWPVLVGKILLASKEKREEDFVSQLKLARKEQTGPLSAASMELGSYYRGYEHILRLHMINEIEEFFKVFASFPEEKDGSDVLIITSPADLLNNWQSRVEMAQSSYRTQEPILTLRRTLLSLVESERDPCLLTQVGKWWLWSAKVARKAGYLQSAHGCLLQASSYHLPDFYLEKAKWLWEKGEQDSAISCLDKGITEHFSRYQDEKKRQELSSSLRQVYAKSLLLYGRYSEETSNLETNAVVKLYRDVIEICPDWEDGYFHLAKYYDRVMNMIIDEKERVEKQGEFIIHVVRYFGQSLKYGNQHIYQSLPRLLSLWLDYGTAVVDAEKKDRSKSSQKLVVQRTVLKRINTLIQQLNEQLAPYQMFTAFPQLISRICHAQPDVFQQLEEIISDLLVKYPHQAMWMMMSVSKSSYPMRVKRCQDIFVTAMHKDGNLGKFIQDCKKLTERLLELCEKDFGNCSTINLNQSFKPLKRLLDDSKFSRILLPLQSAVTVKLPATLSEGMEHNPFPDTQVYIQGFDDTIEILHSLQKPKKITMIGSDGNRYVMMCKPKDDLRKDCRLMEFNTIINRFLHRDAESRKRRLLIRTYTVTPLNEECGLIEWVNNTTGLRNILVSIYKEQGFYMSGKELKANMPALHSDLEAKMKIYKEKLLPRHPPLFPVWFMRTFPDPTSWYSSRVSYARTAAVMSIVGYILGLGDRHGENILLDSTTGDCVHVDFNCLFNKGETFEWPERVPFRLTHNMIAAMGPLGIEGLFRQACEITLRVIRNQMDPLMSVLKPFIYDPLVEWSKPSRGQRSNATDSGEINNELALSHVQNIEDRMRGILKTKAKPRCLPLSIEGHVNYLLQEATDDKNLCQMYIGWAAYM
ncbi:hypothetical protein EGW08_008382 [Elysia chlorotica]|uniref:Serine/threonine-protein kinase ATR n=1 Tax=Elysia chlorotica TaxID=188477 RepID=A0A3S0ZVD3_ELYCH|nr:hypothetical protein EGW08_008382 [Elysia chlorotica]